MMIRWRERNTQHTAAEDIHRVLMLFADGINGGQLFAGFGQLFVVSQFGY